MFYTPMKFYLTLKSLIQDGEGTIVDVGLFWLINEAPHKNTFQNYGFTHT